jgi:hypothetical protein
MKLFSVTAQITFVVQAESELAALIEADVHALDAARDEGLGADFATEIRGIEHLPAGWTGAEYPYGGTGDQCISDILASMPPVVERDTRTIDMFEAGGAA